MPDIKFTGDASSVQQAAAQVVSANEQVAASVKKAAQAAKEAQADQERYYQSASQQQRPGNARAGMGADQAAWETKRNALRTAAGGDGKAEYAAASLELKRLSTAHDEAATGAGKHMRASNELKKLMAQISQESPALGLALRAAFSPAGAAILMAGMALSSVGDNLKRLDEMAQSTHLKDFEEQAREMEKSLLSLQEASAKSAREFENIGKAAETASQHVDRLLEVQNALRDEEQKLNAAREKLALSRAATIANPVERASAELDIKKHYREVERARQDRVALEDVEAISRKMYGERNTVANAAGPIAAAEETVRKLGTKEAVNKEVEKGEIRVEDLKKKIAAAKAELEDSKYNINCFTGSQEVKLTLAKDMKGFAAELISSEEVLKDLKAGQLGKLTEIDAANESLAKMTAERNAAQTRLKDLEAKLATAEQVAGIAKRARATAAPIEDEAEAIREREKMFDDYAEDPTDEKKAAIDAFDAKHWPKRPAPPAGPVVDPGRRGVTTSKYSNQIDDTPAIIEGLASQSNPWAAAEWAKKLNEAMKARGQELADALFEFNAPVLDKIASLERRLNVVSGQNGALS